jgi:hypothetical protein
MCTPTHRITAPFSPSDMHPHPSYLASTQTPHLAPPPFPAPPALKPTRPDSSPPASRQPQDAIRTDAASAESLEVHDAKESETKKPRHQDAHGEQALAHHTLASQGHLAKPANWDSMTRKARKNWKMKQAKNKKVLAQVKRVDPGLTARDCVFFPLRPRSYDVYTSPRPPSRPRRHKHVQTPSPTLQAIFFF